VYYGKKLVLGIDIKEKQVLGIKKRHKTSFGDQGRSREGKTIPNTKLFVLNQFHDAKNRLPRH
jgi:hypothetical protein